VTGTTTDLDTDNPATILRHLDLGTLVAWLLRRVPDHSISYRDLQAHIYLIEWYFVQRTGRSTFGYVWVNDGGAIHGIGIRKDLVACQNFVLPKLDDLDGQIRLVNRVPIKHLANLETIIEAYQAYNNPPRDSGGLYLLVRESFPCKSTAVRESFLLEERKLALRRPPAPNSPN